MYIRIRERDGLSRRWTVRLDVVADWAAPAQPGELSLNEANEVEVFLGPFPMGTDARVLVGDALVASSLPADRADFPFHPLEDDGDTESLIVRGRLVRDWIGLTELLVLVRDGDEWRPVLVARPMHVTAGKIAQEDFEQLCEDVASDSAAALLDVYGKTFFGLELEYRRGESAPVAAAVRIRQALDQLATALHEIAAQPAYRLKTRRVREPALAEQGVGDLTLEEACLDPTLAVRYRGGIAFREQVREVADPHFNLTENRIISGFLKFLVAQVAELTGRLHADIAVRMERKAFRDRPGPDGAKSWWEAEDWPRVVEMRRVLENLRAMRGEIARLSRYPFLPPGAELRDVPQSTPLIRSNRAYAAAYRVTLAHFRAFRVRLDGGNLLTRGKSLPVLYEWWCFLEVLRVLRQALTQREGKPDGSGTPFRRLASERAGFVVEFGADQAIDFEDGGGRLIRLRYVPSYRRPADAGGSAYGLLGPEGERTPDIALEVFPASDLPTLVPDLIVVFDAKYTTQPHLKKLEEVRLKYGKVGVFDTGKVLSRQVWALVPSAPVRPSSHGPEWSAHCTADNVGFWSENYDMSSSTAGVVRAKPRMGEGRAPLDGLLWLILKRANVAVRG